MEIYVCIGSSCHLKGSYDIISGFQKLIADNHLEDRVELNAAFCLGNCTNGVTIKVNDRIVSGVSKDNLEGIFNDYVLSKLEG